MNDRKKLSIPGLAIQLLIALVLLPLLPVLISGRWNWWEAWTYAFIYVAGFIASRALASRRSPDLLSERARSMEHENTESWDKLLAPLVAFGGAFIALAAGLDMRYDWSPEISLPVEIIAVIFILAGYVLGTYALVENRFFSGVVRIQSERGHQVVSSGPYRWIRHPGYASILLNYLALPLLLDSLWAYLPAIGVVAVVVVRTLLEDRMLKEKLGGYLEYARRVRYRLVPGVW